MIVKYLGKLTDRFDNTTYYATLDNGEDVILTKEEFYVNKVGFNLRLESEAEYK